MLCFCFFFFQAEDGIRDLVRSRGLGDVYKRQEELLQRATPQDTFTGEVQQHAVVLRFDPCLLYTSDAADERSSVDLGGRRIIKKKKKRDQRERSSIIIKNASASKEATRAYI